jgi:hypothetical protein
VQPNISEQEERFEVTRRIPTESSHFQFNGIGIEADKLNPTAITPHFGPEMKYKWPSLSELEEDATRRHGGQRGLSGVYLP